MPDETHADPFFFIERNFEWKDDRHPIDGAGNPANPPASPSPHLRADIIKYRHLQLLCQSRQAEVELGKINQDEEIGPLLSERTPKQAVGFPENAHVILQ